MNFGQASPPADESFEDISVGVAHTCGLRSNGSPACWGNDENGQSAPPGDEGLSVIAAGSGHTCGLRLDGTAVCWGQEPYSDGHTDWEETPEGEFVSLDAAAGYTCAITTRGFTDCWGGWSDVVLAG